MIEYAKTNERTPRWLKGYLEKRVVIMRTRKDIGEAIDLIERKGIDIFFSMGASLSAYLDTYIRGTR